MRGLPRRATSTILILISLEIWKEGNARIFNNKSATAVELRAKIKEEVELGPWQRRIVWSNFLSIIKALS